MDMLPICLFPQRVYTIMIVWKHCCRFLRCPGTASSHGVVFLYVGLDPASPVCCHTVVVAAVCLTFFSTRSVAASMVYWE